MTDRRWDVVLRVASGPTASREPRTHRGPQVVVGTDPGPGGVVLPGGRGIAPRHCTITANDPTSVWVSPVGHNPVRLAPYADVQWEELEPIRGRARLERGSALHLGVTGTRGITLVFHECVDLGLRSSDRLLSEGESAAEEVAPADVPPDGFEAVAQRPRVQDLLAESGGPETWVYRLVVALLGSAVLVLAAAFVIFLLRADRPTTDPEFVWEPQRVEAWTPVAARTGSFEAAILALLVEPSLEAAEAAGASPEEHGLTRDPATWDGVLVGTLKGQVDDLRGALRKGRRHAEFATFHDRGGEYLRVVEILREAGLPEVLAGIPYVESRYRSSAESGCCARGIWQFMPEFGARYRALEGFGAEYDVRACVLEDAPLGRPFTPIRKAPPPQACRRGAYIGLDGCNLGRCEADFRVVNDLATRVAVSEFRRVLEDPQLARSGAVVPMIIASHHTGYHDALWEPERYKPKNVLLAYRKWLEDVDDTVPTSRFFGDVYRCDDRRTDVDGCGEECDRYLCSATQRYVPKVVFAHLMAMCWFATHEPDHPVALPWAPYARDGGFCTTLDLPSPDLVGG